MSISEPGDSGLAAIEGWARQEFDRKNTAREQALRLSREMIRACATSIRAIHRRELDRAGSLIGQAESLNAEMQVALEGMGDLYWTGYVQDAQKELVEAVATLAFVAGNPLPDPGCMGIAPAAYVNGLAEVVGELRRYVLDQLRRGEVDQCDRLLRAMDDIYSLLVTLDYPDALTGGLRRSTDNARGILEKTRGDLTVAVRQEALQRALAELAPLLANQGPPSRAT